MAGTPRRTVVLLVAAAVCAGLAQGYPCGWPGSPAHGDTTPKSQLFYTGETANITCREGFVRFGQARRTCKSDGTWDDLMPFCRPNMAYQGHTQGPLPPFVTPGAALGQFDHRLAVDGDMATCSRAPRELQQRWWQVRLPASTRVEAVGLVVPADSVLDIKIFIISLNRSPESANYQLCANFSGALPQAKRLFRCGPQGLVGEYVYIRDERSHHDYFTLCEVEVFQFGEIFCERPPPLENGYMDASVASLSRYPFNATARYRCAAGFAMQGGSTVRTCAVNGRWTGTAPRCQPLVCPMPAALPNARYKLLNSTTRWQAVAEHTCQDGFVSANDSAASVLSRCTDSGFWQPVNISCVPLPAPPPVPEVRAEDSTGAEVSTGAEGSTGKKDGPVAAPEHAEHEHEHMSSGVVAGLAIAAVVAIAAMIIVGIVFTRKRFWVRRKRSSSSSPVVPPADVKTYDQVYEPSYQNVIQGPPPALLSFRAPGSQRAGSEPRGRPVEPPYETLKARLAEGVTPYEPEDTYEPVSGGRLYDDVAAELDSGPYQSLGGPREPDYETLRAMRGEEGDYDLVPARSGASQVYDSLSGNYENCRFGAVEPAGHAEVPDLLKGASEQAPAADIPPEILALYAKVVKSKKSNRDSGEVVPTALPRAANDSACPSSPGSSAASSYTRNLINKFNKLAKTDDELEQQPATGTPPTEERVQYTQIDCPPDGAEVRRPATDPVVYSTLRPLPPVPQGT